MSDQVITASLVLGVLGGHIGERRGITGDQLARKCTGRDERDPGAERLVRRLIQELRTEGCHICGHPGTGYFLAANGEELDRACAFLYSRAMTTLVQIARMKKVSVPDLRGQFKLPT